MKAIASFAITLLCLTQTSVHAAPIVDEWTCGAELTLLELAGNATQADAESLEKCADGYLAWALDRAKTHPPLTETIKARHAAFLAYTRGLTGVAGVDVRALKTKLGEADMRVEVEAKAAGL